MNEAISNLLYRVGSRVALLALNGLSPSRGYSLRKNLGYGALERQRLDLYVPVAGGAGRPMVLFFHGGRWSNGSKDDYPFIAEALTSRGFVAAVANYRLYPSVRFPTFVEDAALAVAWTRSAAEDHGADPRKLFVMGHSAGAHLAALLALDPRYLGAVGGGPGWLAGMIGLAGPYDFLPIREADLRDMFGPEPDHPRSQPLHFANGAGPPMLLAHGGADSVVGPRNTRNLAVRVNDSGGSAETFFYDGLDHTRILAALAAPLRFIAPVLDDITAFVNDHL